MSANGDKPKSKTKRAKHPRLVVLRRHVAANVRRLRMTAGLTLAVASERAGLDLRHWQKIEAAEMNITLGTLAKLANGLGVDVTILLERPRR
jgi:transcriptional regulator with XRE-family HTH domain